MRLAVSNLAWERPDDEDVASLLSSRDIDAVDLVPGKYFTDPESASDREVNDVATWWRTRGIEITGMQALVFGVANANLFGDDSARKRLLRRLTAICRIAGILHAPRLVFGSPKQRDRAGLNDGEAASIARDFFRQLGDVAADCGVFVCLEPNPERYGCNFMTTCASTAEVVRSVDHPAILMQLDLGALTINGEAVSQVVARYGELIGHVHASEPDLVPLGDGDTKHVEAAAVLRTYLPDRIVSVEVRAGSLEPRLRAITRSLDVACGAYR